MTSVSAGVTVVDAVLPSPAASAPVLAGVGLEPATTALAWAGMAGTAGTVGTVGTVGTAGTEAVATPRAARRVWLRRAFIVGLLAALLVEATLAAPYVARGADALADSKVSWLVVAVVAELVSMRAFARMRRRMLAAGGVTVRLRKIESLTYASSAVGATFPGGAALSSGFLFKRLRHWGATVPAAGFTVLASNVLSVVAYSVLAVVGAVLAGNGGVGTFLVVGAVLAGTASVVAVGRRTGTAGLLGAARRVLRLGNRALRRPREAGVAALDQLVTDLRAIHPRARDWAAGLVFGVVNWGADLACLVLCCQAVGADKSSIALVMIAYVAGQSVSGLTITPGGLGIIDAAMIFALTQGGETLTLATAAVMLYRLISLAMVAAVGWSLWLGTVVGERRAVSRVA